VSKPAIHIEKLRKTMSLKDDIIADIRKNGPMPLSDYMQRCNAHYYATKIPFGTQGDFITAPDISQMFGELIGMWCADVWQRAGSPNPFRLIELGPGRGTLMADALRATKNVPGFHAALSVHFVETSMLLRAEQKKRVPQAIWHETLAHIGPPCASIVIANEFFDALGISQMIKIAGDWFYRVVDYGAAKQTLFWATDVKNNHPGDTALYQRHVWPWCVAAPDEADGSIRERQEGISIVSDFAFALEKMGGALLIIDYGHTASAPGDTLQAMMSHAYVDPLAEPGTADLTAHVDFGQLAHPVQFSECAVHGPTTQGQFLRKLGLDARAAMLARANPARAEDFFADAARLADSDQMGTLFKVMAITSKNWPTPAGFES
jgi:NADH dehydrogenase [ubiquinone] 1 alpha subcomplex assembly factor 7